MAMSDNILGKSYQLKLNNMNYHVYCYMEFGANFSTYFGVLSIIFYFFISQNRG